MITRPMLAATIEDTSKLKYPLLATPKIDGIRCLIYGWRAVSRTLKPIPNHFIRHYLEDAEIGYYNLDGELIVGNTFQSTSSGVMSRDGEPDFTYVVFDILNDSMTYEQRVSVLRSMESHPHYQFLIPILVENEDQLNNLLAKYLAEGYEGVMLRTPDSPYKSGRSTLREGYLMKLKPFADSEAIVIGFEERMHNANALRSDNFGLAKRSSCQDFLHPENTLGALVVRDVSMNVEFSIGSGFTDSQRKWIWNHRSEYLNRVLTYKYQRHGMKDKPRCPIFKGWRLDI